MDKDDRIKVLYIDDEDGNLIGFRAQFRFDYQVFLASNVNEALKVLEEEPDLRVIISDQRMPDQTGTAFFEEIRVIYPMPVRILLTAFTDDRKAMLDAINKGNVYRYINKPWSIESIQMVLQDANKYYLTNSLLKIKHKELEHAYKELDKFAHNVSHDLRGPLTGIMSAAQLAMELRNPDEMREVLQIITKSVEQLDKYIIQIQDYYSIKTGEFSIGEVDLESVAHDMRAIYETTANAKGIDFDIVIRSNKPFQSDEVAIRLILSNLLSNAFKYQKTDDGEKYVLLEMEVMDRAVKFVVKDSGVGIKKEFLNKIYNLFFRGSSLGEVGSGLGLYNVKNILNKMGGEIAVNSKENEGSEFIVLLPIS